MAVNEIVGQERHHGSMSAPAGAPLNLEIPSSRYFRAFMVQLDGVSVGAQVDVLVSVDGTNYAALYTTIATTNASGDAVFQFELVTPSRGDIRIRFTNALAGSMYYSMDNNPYARRPHSAR